MIHAVTDTETSELELFFFFQAEDGIRDVAVTGVQTCALPISFGIVHRGGVWAASLAPGFSTCDEQCQKDKHGADERMESLPGTIRYAPRTLCRKIERTVVENGVHALGGFGDYLGQRLATGKKTVIRGVGMPSRHKDRVG